MFNATRCAGLLARPWGRRGEAGGSSPRRSFSPGAPRPTAIPGAFSQCPNGRAGAATPALRPSPRSGGASLGTAPAAPKPAPSGTLRLPTAHPALSSLLAEGRQAPGGTGSVCRAGNAGPLLLGLCPKVWGGNGGIRCSRDRRAGQARPPAAACALSGWAGPAPQCVRRSRESSGLRRGFPA